MTSNSPANACGEYAFTWFSSYEGGAKQNFVDRFTVDGDSGEFVILYPSTSSASFGTYTISYEVEFQNYLSVTKAEQTQAFTVTLKDVCELALFTASSSTVTIADFWYTG